MLKASRPDSPYYQESQQNMATRNDDLIARRKAALNGKPRTVPTTDVVEATSEPLNADPVDGTTQVLQPRSNNASGSTIALPQVDLTRELDASDLIMPKLKICQAMSKVSRSGIPQGNYYHSTLNEDLGNTVRIIPVDMRKSRSLFKTGIGIVCRSFDLLQGEGDPGILCEGTPEERATLPAKSRGCPLRMWGDKVPETGRSSPPPCSINYNFPVLILDKDDPENGPTKRGIITFRGTGTQIAKAINSMITEQDLYWNEAVLELGTEEKANWKGTFFVPTVKFIGNSSGMAAEKAKRFGATLTAGSVRASVEAYDSDDE